MSARDKIIKAAQENDWDVKESQSSLTLDLSRNRLEVRVEFSSRGVITWAGLDTRRSPKVGRGTVRAIAKGKDKAAQVIDFLGDIDFLVG